jgi:hypothetical protein
MLSFGATCVYLIFKSIVNKLCFWGSERGCHELVCTVMRYFPNVRSTYGYELYKRKMPYILVCTCKTGMYRHKPGVKDSRCRLSCGLCGRALCFRSHTTFFSKLALFFRTPATFFRAIFRILPILRYIHPLRPVVPGRIHPLIPNPPQKMVFSCPQAPRWPLDCWDARPGPARPGSLRTRDIAGR